MKIQKAEDANLATLKFPCWGMPKIDGVNAWCPSGAFVGRSMDPFPGFGITEFWSQERYIGLCGEMVLGNDPTAEGLCRTTTGALGRFKGVTERAEFTWWIFDFVGQDGDVKHLPYETRYNLAKDLVEMYGGPLRLVPYDLIENIEQATALISRHLAEGYEGTIWRNHKAAAKEGKASAVGLQQYLRTKPWMDSEMLCTGFEEGNKNTNEAKKNTAGNTERSSAKEGLVPNGEIGALLGILLEDIVSPYTGKPLFKKGLPVRIGTGEMKVKEAKHLFENPDEIVNHIIKFKHFAHDVLNSPRQGTYLSHRLPQDMG